MGNIYTWKNDTNVSLWFAKMSNRITDIDGKRTESSITSILPVVKDNTKQLSLEFSEQEKKITLDRLKRYLSTTANLS